MGLDIISDIIHHDQVIPSAIWIINHNLNTTAPVVDCWINDNGNKSKIIPLSVVGTDVNTCTISFTLPTVGSATLT